MTQSLEEKLQLVLDRQEIQQVLGTYCRAIDRLDVELLKSVYHPDATDDHGSFSGSAHEFAEFITASMAKVIIDGMHTVTHSVIEVEGNFATAESYYLAYQLCPGGLEAVTGFFGERYAQEQIANGTIDKEQDYICGGRYIDLLEKRDGAWRILRRRITNEWNICQTATRIVDQGHIAHFNLPGRRDREDPVYLNTLPGRR